MHSCDIYRNGRFGPGFGGRPLPEEATEPMVDEYLRTAAQYFASGGDPDSVTPVPSGSVSVSHRWSDSTLTGTFSGRCSSYSWGADEAVRTLLSCLVGVFFNHERTMTLFRFLSECAENNYHVLVEVLFQSFF